MAIRRRDSRVAWLDVVIVVIVVVSLSVSFNEPQRSREAVAPSTGVGPDGAQVGATTASLLSLSDDGSVSQLIDGTTAILADKVTLGPGTPAQRSYTVSITTLHPSPSLSVNLTTRPVADWSQTGQFPDGPSTLPRLFHWVWTVDGAGVADTANWSVASPFIYRTIPWMNASYTVSGVPDFLVPVTVNATAVTGVRSTGVGLVPGQQLPSSIYSKTLSLAQSVDPSLVRWTQVSEAPATWHNSTQTVSFNFNAFAPMMNLTRSLHSQSLLSLPAGSWGDGNVLPAGMPLNKSLLVNWYGHSTGYFPTTTAYRTYVTTLAKDVKAHGWTISYWNVGNEVPIWISLEYAKGFATAFNVASSAIHSVFPSALVGSDVITAPGKLQYFATTLQGVGFLGFHFYPAGRLCLNATTFCIPDGQNGYLTNNGVLNATAGLAHSWQFAPPQLSRQEWFNYTGKWLPILDEESNLNSAQAQGTDPRQQTLFDAAWLAWMYMTASAQSVRDVTTYSLLSNEPLPDSPTLAYGGWGFGLAVEPPNGSVIHYAPYWAARLWGSNVPALSRELLVKSGNPYYIPAYAVANGSGINVVVVNLANVDATISVSVSGGSYGTTTVWTLDGRTYRMYFDSQTNSEELGASGLTVQHLPGGSSATVTIDGYGLAVISFS
ncbi:MAG: hypothetical protein ABSE66_03690 [Thermoplasmata archaeon]|jgi:hypothetical protein